MRQIEIRPVQKQTWHNNKDVEAIKGYHIIEPIWDQATGKLKTGLTEEQEKKYSQKLAEDISSKDYIPTDPHPFWSFRGKVKLESSPMFFNPEIPLDFVRIQMLKEHPSVANSLKEYEEGKFPDATHIIFDEEEEVTNRASKVQTLINATKKISSMSNKERTDMLWILSGKNVKGKSADFIEVTLYTEVEKDPSRFLEELQVDKKTRDSKALILECLFRGILRKDAYGVYFMDEKIGDSVNLLATELNEADKNHIKIKLLELVNN